METTAVISSEWEAGFSEVHVFATLMRSQLKIENVSALMFIKLVGPPLTSWEAAEYGATRGSTDHHHIGFPISAHLKSDDPTGLTDILTILLKTWNLTELSVVELYIINVC